MESAQSRYSSYGGVAFTKSMESKLLKNISCSNCLQIFAVRDPLHPRGLRCPLILHCGHSVCENCVRTSLRNANSVVCVICKQTSTPANPNVDVRQDFPLNIYLLGVFAARHWGQEPEDSKISFAPAGTAMSNRKNSVAKVMQENKKTEICSECVERNAEWQCHQCEVSYCGQCFTKVHKAAKALSKHKKSLLEELYQRCNLAEPVCGDHPNQKLEFFCKECSEVVCSHCVICVHQGHPVITRKQKNEESMIDLDNAKEKATEVMKRLLHTQKKLGDILMIPAQGGNLTSVEKEITRHFVYLHGALQLLEQNLIEKLKAVKTESSHRLESIVNEVNSNIQNVRQLIQEAVNAKDPANISKVEMSAIVDSLLAVQQFPCHLVATDLSITDTTVRFTVDESFLEQMENHCTLDVHIPSSYSLVKTEDLPPDAVVEPIDDDTESDAVASVSSRASSVSGKGDAILASIEQIDANKNQKKNVGYSRNVVQGTSDIVTVCHLRDPSSFYVHRVADNKTLDNLCKQLSKHVDTFSSKPRTVLKDGLYIVQYHVDGKWYRARVRAILPSLSDDQKEECVDILYVDYGNSEVIPSSRLRCIPPRFSHTPAIALHCSIFGLTPCNDKWSQDAVKALALMVNGYRVKMVIMEHKNDIFEVDLCQLPGELHESDVPISVRDALVFLEYGYFLDEPRQKVNVSQRSMKFFQEDGFEKGSVVDVVVSHVETPHSFYVQRLGDHARYLTSVMKDMNLEYQNIGNKGLVYTPQIGMPCAAQYNVDKKWYRAKVIDLPGNKMVEVVYVDYGNQEVTSWDRLRKIHPRFLRIAAQAIHCSLSDIVPNQQQWTHEVKDFVIKTTSKKVLRLYIDEVQRCQLKVTMYESQAEVDLCLNALLVREGFATSVGVSSSLVEYHKLDGLPLPPPQYNTKQTLNKPTKKKPAVKTPNTRGAGDMTAPKQSNMTTVQPVEDPFRIEVKILNCSTPGSIYVALTGQEVQIKSLMCDLQDYYATCRSNVDTWQINNKCCVFSVQQKQWYRAIIVELLPNELAKVFLKDFAEIEVVPLSNLQLLDPKFLEIRDGAIKCHLAGVQAAGDKSEWPSLACEYLSEQIAKYPNIYITKKGDIENWSLPVELWVKHVRHGGPLEPTQEEWLMLNKKLIEQGLAIPLRGESEVQSIPSTQVLKELDEQCQDANRNNVSDWLKLSFQLENCVTTECSEVVQEASMNGSLSDIEDEAETEQEEGHLPPVFSDWLPPVPINKTEFLATPTYVDDECYIYLHDTEKSKDTLTVIGNALHSRFVSSQAKPHDLYWFPGQLCIAQYHSDKKWYRGKVIEVNEDRTVKVLFVDYGNVEECKASEMRKNVYMGHFPIQSHKCQLDGIKAASENGKWSSSTLDFIHTTIVEKQCHVTIKQEPKIGQPLMISLIGPGNINIAELLVGMQFAIYTSMPILDSTANSETGTMDEEASVFVEDEETIGDEETMEEEEETVEEEKEEGETIKETEGFRNEKNVNDAKCSKVEWNALIEQEELQHKTRRISASDMPQFKVCELPQCDTIVVEVTAIVSPTELVIHPVKVEDSELLEMKEQFEKLTLDLQKNAQSQPLIKEPFIGQPCCACYATDNLWYRAAVLDTKSREPEKKELKIQYVDYGNVEYQPIDKVHTLKPEWTAVPMQGLHCKLWGVQCPDKWDPQVLYPKLMECLYNPPLLAKIKARKPLLEVELLTSDGSVLVWQSLVEKGLLVQKEQSVL